MYCDSQCITKGGVRIIRDGVFAVTISDNNEAIAADADVARAHLRTPGRFVFSGGKSVDRLQLPANRGVNVIGVLYTPEKIQFYDWKDFSGTHDKRSREGKPNQPAEPTRAQAPR